MTCKEVLQELESKGTSSYKNTLIKHGAKEPFFGVKVSDLKNIIKKTKKDHQLALELYNTGNSDAMYLAGLMADEDQVTKKQLEDWAKKAYWSMLFEYTVPWIAAESKFGFEMGLKWIKSKKENIASCGWATLSSLASITDDEKLDLKQYDQLLDKVSDEIDTAQNRVKYTMNGFVIAVGCYIPKLTKKAEKIAGKIGKVAVFMGDTSCKVPLATEYIKKVADKGKLGKKRKMARC